MNLRHVLDSLVLRLRTPWRMRRFEKLRVAGRKSEALQVGRECLDALRQMKAGPALSCMMIVVDQLAAELKMPGVAEPDLRRALHALQQLPVLEAKPDVALTIADYIAYLEKRLGMTGVE